MIRLVELSKSYRIHGRRHVVADRITATFPAGVSVALLGRNGAGKSSLLKMIAGTMEPTSGQILAQGSVSYPVGFAGSFHGDLSGAQNVRFVARIYGVDSDELVDFVADFAELGRHFHEPFRTYSSGMRARLSFGASMGLPFDHYLIDEVTSVGDARFRKKSERMLRDRLRTAGAIYVSHSLGQVRKLCTCGAVLEGGRLTWHETLRDAILHHQRNLTRG
ncbi:ATP-binding protein [Defluviimonas sp. 20V17]|uniref:ATP-binding protein n=1 Tax=Allgaiera indica TaxID=765699 RepID=A0AAN4URV1_9RHOB|nr:ABC transporter ATP-binding protein [Allgaiera indica]KDB02546.1 ATP-binding protein [Defluviimonas sp. 20V17]GHE01583.1 ATP-binding protein [Allgaiera indica]SDW98505.1 capsular polysaccharide transport system ATP-binding protein [Allgaiera indica]